VKTKPTTSYEPGVGLTHRNVPRDECALEKRGPTGGLHDAAGMIRHVITYLDDTVLVDPTVPVPEEHARQVRAIIEQLRGLAGQCHGLFVDMVERRRGDFSWERVVAEAAHDQDPPEAAHHPDGVRRLVKTLRRAQLHCGDQPFFVSCAQAAEVVGGVSRQTAWMALQWLCSGENPVLRQVTKGGREAGGHSKASEYLYLPVVNARDSPATRARV
jgi:hypothetical protein